MLQYSVKLHSFEGPLDLLLHLIQKNDLDLYDIPVREITEQYMTYIHAMQVLHLDIASEYLVMAATLLQMKSKLLLPVEEETLDEDLLDYEEDPRDELMQKLIEYKRYKDAASDLKERENKRSDLFSRPMTDLTPFLNNEDQEPQLNASIYDMLKAFKMMNRRHEREKPVFRKVQRDAVPIETQMGYIMQNLGRNQGVSTFSVLVQESNSHERVVTFLALLELMKSKAVRCEQPDNFHDIWIYRREV